jgi:prephenate dehydrogenase
VKALAGKKIVIIGMGLIGGSIARGLAGLGFDGEVVGVGRDTVTLSRAINDGCLTSFTTDVQTACFDADIVVIAVPVLTIESVLQELAPVLAQHTVVTDVASVKQAVVNAAQSAFGEVPDNFVPGHPIAGSEQSGYAAAKPDLFLGRRVILTPLQHTNADAVNLVTELWQVIGAEVLQMSVAHHDEVLAATSLLPHLLAFGLVDTLSQQGESEEIFRFAAGGFRDFTRIASSDPVMWRDIFLTNARAIVAILDEYTADLGQLRAALLAGDSRKLFTLCERANRSREVFLTMNSRLPKPGTSKSD